MSEGIIFHVAPAVGDGWSVTREGRRNSVAWSPRKESAIERARRELVKFPNGRLKIHGEDYAIEEELTAEEVTSAANQDHRQGDHPA